MHFTRFQSWSHLFGILRQWWSGLTNLEGECLREQGNNYVVIER